MCKSTLLIGQSLKSTFSGQGSVCGRGLTFGQIVLDEAEEALRIPACVHHLEASAVEVVRDKHTDTKLCFCCWSISL